MAQTNVSGLSFPVGYSLESTYNFSIQVENAVQDDGSGNGTQVYIYHNIMMDDGTYISWSDPNPAAVDGTTVTFSSTPSQSFDPPTLPPCSTGERSHHHLDDGNLTIWIQNPGEDCSEPQFIYNVVYLLAFPFFGGGN